MYQRYVEITDVPSNIKKWVKSYKKVNSKMKKISNKASQKFFSDTEKRFEYLERKGLYKLHSKSSILFNRIDNEWLRVYPPQVGEIIEYSNGFGAPILEAEVVSWDPNTKSAVVKKKNNHKITLGINSIGYEYMFCNTNVYCDMTSSH